MMKLVRFIAFYGSWVLSVYSPQLSYPTLFSFAGLVPLLVLFFYNLKNPLQVARAMSMIVVVGLGIDSLLRAWGYFWFPLGSDLPWPLIPSWYPPLWIGFAVSMVDLEPMLRRKWWLSALLGAVGGPASFIAGEKMGALVIVGPVWILSIIWALLVPAIVAFLSQEAKK